jgi:negative regulator of flagellin synthesis FlgM
MTMKTGPKSQRMRIATGSNPTAPATLAPLADSAAPEAAPAAAAAPLQSAVLQPALAALRAMPNDVDQERVDELRNALARGELPFDPARLAGLIARFHGGKP